MDEVLAKPSVVKEMPSRAGAEEEEEEEEVEVEEEEKEVEERRSRQLEEEEEEEGLHLEGLCLENSVGRARDTGTVPPVGLACLCQGARELGRTDHIT
ncbi:unnamed protein product [Gadus morhua 'NCC']